ncbi:hypothetical protein [Caballeronia sp. Lep1P3]|uniref:hypothetical protein n=1 Tax=Caballeronia sp. Lep1P3 TaxID=2878150 RepID=UPI001FD10732|nr:hypothetical protein [Caballeronia sp. Lep1P3]
MPRIASLAVCMAAFAASCLLSACADSSTHKHPPQDPPDYKGVPTDTRPPSMLIAPTQSE